jgi:hypothetical protein
MKRFAAAAVVGLLPLLSASATTAEQDLTKPIVRAAIRNSFAVMLAPRPKDTTHFRVFDCGAGRCRFRVVGTGVCRGVARTGRDDAGDYAWVPRRRCHTRQRPVPPRQESPPGGEFSP